MNRLLSSLSHDDAGGAAISATQFNSAAERAGVGVWIADLRQKTTSYSAGFVKLLSPDHIGAFDLMKVLKGTLDPKCYEDVGAAFDAAVAIDAPAQLEVDCCIRAGRPDARWVKLTLAGELDTQTQSPSQLTVVIQDATKEFNAKAQAQALVQEMNHRVKNMLSVVQSVAYQSFRHDIESSGHFSDFQGRLRALAKAQDLLIEERFEGASFSSLSERIVESSGAPVDRLTIRGFPLRVGPKQAVSFSIILHELTINALKYGAFSLPSGKVELSWKRNKTSGMVNLNWIERDGPTVIEPAEKGFGTRMIERAIALEFGGAVSCDFAPEGLEVQMTIPFKTLDQDKV